MKAKGVVEDVENVCRDKQTSYTKDCMKIWMHAKGFEKEYFKKKMTMCSTYQRLHKYYHQNLIIYTVLSSGFNLTFAIFGI